MRKHRRSLFVASVVALLVSSVVSTAASAQEDNNRDSRGGRAVFVQSNDPASNQVLVYHRQNNGALSPAGAYNTGGQGGRLNGAMVDPLASQGALQFAPTHNLLIGVNAGSNTVYAFSVDGERLSHRQVVASHGIFPVSIAVHDDLVYVLNARGTGSVHGYRITDDGDLASIPGSTRSLNLTPDTTATEFLHTPGQVGFTPDGDHLIVTTKANGSRIDVFAVNGDGRLSAAPVMNTSQTPVPFGFTFDPQRQLVVGEAGASDTSTYSVDANGTLTPIGTATDVQAALCWITADHGIYFVSNAGSGTVSSFKITNGQPELLVNNPVGMGPIDLSAPSGGRFLYVELGGSGSIAELGVSPDGTLTSIGTVAGHAGEEGIVAL